MRKKIVAGNWKMNLEMQPGTALFSEIITMVHDELRGAQEVVVCPPFLHLPALSKLAAGSANVSVGAQNCHQEASGAFTGEISAPMIKSAGAAYVILGHSERRQYFVETDAALAKKVSAVLAAGLLPIFCIGETLDERNAGTHFDVIKTQLKDGLYHLSEAEVKPVVLAYEPVWAIGTGVTASPEQAQEIHAFIRRELATQYNDAVAEETTILYGGSCNPKNAPDLFSQPDIDGGLIGGASLKSRDFVDIAKVFNR